MKNKLLTLSVLNLAFLMWNAGQPQATAEVAAQKTIREQTEWAEMRVFEADKNDLPHVLLIGDSISGGYYQGVADELKGRAYVGWLGTSKSLGDPALFEEIKLMLGQYKFAVIHFNNGLHGWGYSEEDYRSNFPKLLSLLKKHAPDAKLIWATSTTCRTGPNFAQFDARNERVKARNRIAAEFIEKNQIPTDDLYALAENHPEHSQDGVHFKPEATAVQAKQVARYISDALSGEPTLTKTTSFHKPFTKKELANRILGDSRFDTIQTNALQLLTGFTAGSSYGEIWIRDFNTFITGSLRVQSPQKVKEMLLLFFKIQGVDGNVPDGAINSGNANVGYQYRYSDLAPGWAAHKNTVETDQESSLIQAVKKYINATGDRSILTEKVGEYTVQQRMESALCYVLKDRWSEKYGLVKGATTIDWGDVQPQNGWGVVIDDKTKWSIDIYDNAMFLMAINDFISMTPKSYQVDRNWKKVASSLRKNIRKHLWDAQAGKYLPHLYLDGSPFSEGFDEKEILYTGGTACAILAGLHDKKEIKIINEQFLKAAAKEKFATIGMTVYPPYPTKEFPNMRSYEYQNAGDWTWFGGRMIQALAANGFLEEAYTEMNPMINRAIKNNGFFEWYDVRTGEPKGSRDFRGEAGVLYDAIEQLRTWAKENRH